MRIADWRVVPAAGLLLAFGWACESASPRPAPPAQPPEEALNAVLAQKRVDPVATSGSPARWPLSSRHTTHAGRARLPPYEPVVALSLGTGWGCAELDSSGERYRACWLAPAVAPKDRGKRAVRAQRRPWLGGGLAATAERLCARVGADLRCWPALDLLQQAPADLPEPKPWRRSARAGESSVAMAATPTFACALESDALVCRGSDPFAVLPGAVKVSDGGGWPYPFALGHHHGCIRQDLNIACWGRGDQGELGFPAPDLCKDAAGDVACSRHLGLARVQGERESHPPLLVAGDTYTCAVTENFVECWGKSRDGFFSAPGPARIAGLRLNGVASLSAGPRGLCGDAYDRGARCVGAIAAPPRGVTRVVVSQGDDASACGVDADGIVCWGEAYSPPARPSAPIRVRVDHPPDPEAPVLDSPGRWDTHCLIERPCTRTWTKPPRCEGSPDAVPWATLAPRAEAERGRLVRVSGHFLLGPGEMTAMACWRWGRADSAVQSANAPTLCCNASWVPLGLVSEGLALRLEDMDCAGDGSRLCCSAPATGQAIIATGVLEWENGRGDAGWTLREPQLCSLE